MLIFPKPKTGEFSFESFDFFSSFEFKFLLVARQTIVARFSLSVTSHAPAHGHVHIGLGGRLFTLGDIAVTGLALDLRKDDMGLVGIKDVIGLSIDALPRDLLSFFRKLLDFLRLRTFRHGVLMAFQADVNGRQPREALGLVVFVTGVTFEPLIDMLFVVEGDRLFGPGAEREGDKEEE